MGCAKVVGKTNCNFQQVVSTGGDINQPRTGTNYELQKKKSLPFGCPLFASGE